MISFIYIKKLLKQTGKMKYTDRLQIFIVSVFNFQAIQLIPAFWRYEAQLDISYALFGALRPFYFFHSPYERN